MYDPEGFVLRIEECRKKLGLTFQELVAAVQERTDRAKGSGYGTIFSYAKGEGPEEPRERIVRALAQIFGVREQWLRDGEGPRTAALEDLRAEAQAKETDPRDQKALEALRAIDEGTQAFLDSTAPYSTRYQLIETVLGLLTSGGTALEDLEPDLIARAVEAVTRFWALPAKIYGGPPRSRTWYGGYYGAVAALMSFVTEGAPGDDPRLILQRMERAADAAVGRTVAAPRYWRTSGGVSWAPFCPKCLHIYMERERPDAPLVCPSCGLTAESAIPLEEGS